MDRASFLPLPGLRTPRRLALALSPACLWLLTGCAQLRPALALAPTVVRAQAPGEVPLTLPALPTQAPVSPKPPGPEVAPPPQPILAPNGGSVHSLPINLDTVLRLAQDQNGQVAIARAKVDEAFAQRDLAAKAWLPDLWIGTAYYRHEGGIQNEDGTLTHSSFGSLFAGTELRGRFDLREAVFQKVDAERKVWQQKAELSRLTSENLMEATDAYMDLLAARASEAVARDLRSKLVTLLERAEAKAKIEPGVEVEVAAIRAELSQQDQTIRRLRAGARNAAAKLLYLLGLDPSAELVVMDRQLVPFRLVDVNLPVEVFVQQALATGPGIREMEGLLNLINQAAAKAGGMEMLIPTLDVRMAEGLFGTGPGSRSDWDNRFDIAIQARWNLTPWLTAEERKRVAHARMAQANLSYQDLRAKLTMGVQESYESVRSGREQVGIAERQITAATDSYERSSDRLASNLKGASAAEVLGAVRGLERARLTYVQAVRDLDKAQLRLLIILGLGSERCHP
jgi:outer membrane protein TolC